MHRLHSLSVTLWDAGVPGTESRFLSAVSIVLRVLLLSWEMASLPCSAVSAWLPSHSVPGVGTVDVAHQELCMGLERGHPPACVSWEAAGCSSWQLEVPGVPSIWSGQTQKHPGGVQGRGPHVLGRAMCEE